MSNSILNRAAMKKLILAKIASLRPGMEKQLTRVSSSSLDHYENKIKAMIEHDIMVHPSIGRTFRVN